MSSFFQIFLLNLCIQFSSLPYVLHCLTNPNSVAWPNEHWQLETAWRSQHSINDSWFMKFLLPLLFLTHILILMLYLPLLHLVLTFLLLRPLALLLTLILPLCSFLSYSPSHFSFLPFLFLALALLRQFLFLLLLVLSFSFIPSSSFRLTRLLHTCLFIFSSFLLCCINPYLSSSSSPSLFALPLLSPLPQLFLHSLHPFIIVTIPLHFLEFLLRPHGLLLVQSLGIKPKACCRSFVTAMSTIFNWT